MKKNKQENTELLQQMALLCTQVITRCDCEGCNQYATWSWMGIFMCDSCTEKKTNTQIFIDECIPEEFENANSVRKLALMIKEVRINNSKRRIVKTEIIQRHSEISNL